MNTPKPVPSRPYAWVSTIAIVWGGELFSVLTSSIVQMGLIWHIAAQGGSAGTITLASMAGFLPLALIGPFAGVIVDRHPITATLIGSDLFIAAISLVVAMAALLGHAPVWLIMASLFLRAIGSSLHTPAFNALTPMVAPAEQLGRLSGIAQCVQSLGYIAGSAMAAVLYPIFGLGVMALIDVVGALVASLVVWMTRLTTYVRPVSTTATDSEGLSVAVGRMLSETRDGFRVLRADSGLFALLICGFAFSLVISPVSALFPVMCLDHFNSGTSGAATAEVAFSAGMLVSSLVIGATGGFRRRVVSVELATVTYGVATLIAGSAAPSMFPAFLASAVVMGFSSPLYSAPQIALIQERIAPEYLGRVFGLYGSLMAWALPLGTAVSSLFVDSVGATVWFMGSGVAILALAVTMVLIPSIRAIDDGDRHA